MGNLDSFFAMGGYAAYVWPGYGLALVVLVGVLLWTLRGLKARERAFAALKRKDRP